MISVNNNCKCASCRGYKVFVCLSDKWDSGKTNNWTCSQRSFKEVKKLAKPLIVEVKKP